MVSQRDARGLKGSSWIKGLIPPRFLGMLLANHPKCKPFLWISSAKETYPPSRASFQWHLWTIQCRGIISWPLDSTWNRSEGPPNSKASTGVRESWTSPSSQLGFLLHPSFSKVLISRALPKQILAQETPSQSVLQLQGLV